MPRTCRLVVIVCLLLAAVRADAITLRYGATKGFSFRQDESFSATIRVTSGTRQDYAQESSLLARAGYTEVVTKTSAQGVISLTRTLDSGNLSIRRKGTISPARSTLPVEKILLRISDRGRLLGVRPTTPQTGTHSALAAVVATLEAIVAHPPFPNRDVKVGETWRETIVLPDFWDGRPGKVTVDARLLGVAPYKGHTCARIRTAYSLLIEATTGMLGSNVLTPTPPNEQVRIKGTLIARVEYEFDIERGIIVMAKGSVNAEAKVPFTIPVRQDAPVKMTTIRCNGVLTLNSISETGNVSPVATR